MRVKLKISFVAFVCRRITPAHAGKTARQDFEKMREGDHPRACG